MVFGEALEHVKRGGGMRLPKWKTDVVVRAQYPEEGGLESAPYLYVLSRFGRAPWNATMIELFAKNWEITD